MNQFVDITNRKVLYRLMLNLQPEAAPLWGKMKPQQMIEHLIDQVQYTNGVKIPAWDGPDDNTAARKHSAVYTDAEIPRNIFLEELADTLIYPNLETAINQLMKELDTFDRYFNTPDVKVIHGAFGPMDYYEWIIWHGKHFTHHLKQFGVID
ncbi:hypothetical protein [Mucilaginibacter sp. R-33]|uniref:hypothetical protein n=1 Tax=unclassified Mucilaginibacter TaxID=2617802 RepID=UPI003CECFBD3